MAVSSIRATSSRAAPSPGRNLTVGPGIAPHTYERMTRTGSSIPVAAKLPISPLSLPPVASRLLFVSPGGGCSRNVPLPSRVMLQPFEWSCM